MAQFNIKIVGGDIYVWGSNYYGQLGLGKDALQLEPRPKIIQSLMGIPIAFTACGGNHTFAVSKSGAVFGWGTFLYKYL